MKSTKLLAIALAGCLLWSGSDAEDAPLSISTLADRSFEATLAIKEKLGEFDGYRSYSVEWLSDGLKQSAVMNVPAAPAPESGYPIVVLSHGNANGRWDTFRNYYSREQESGFYQDLPMTPMLTSYAREGFVVLLPDYRGHGYSETNGRNEGFWQLDRSGTRVLDKNGNQVPRVMDDDGLRFGGWLYSTHYTVDILHLISALESRRAWPADAPLDTSNLFLWGRSLGGDVTARAIAISDRVRAASLWVPATMSLWDQAHHYHYDSPCCADGFSLEAVLVELRKYNELHGTRLRARDLNPANFIDRVESPVLIQVSIDDRGVRSAWGIQYHYALLEYGIDTELIAYPGEDHVFIGDTLSSAMQADLEFFRANIK